VSLTESQAPGLNRQSVDRIENFLTLKPYENRLLSQFFVVHEWWRNIKLFWC